MDTKKVASELLKVAKELLAAGTDPKIKKRLEYLRKQLRAERISYSELHELQSLADHIEPGDTELLEAAGVSEEEARKKGKL